MPRYSVELIIQRTYATVEVEADDDGLAREAVMNMQVEDLDGTSEDLSWDVFGVEEVTPAGGGS